MDCYVLLVSSDSRGFSDCIVVVAMKGHREMSV